MFLARDWLQCAYSLLEFAFAGVKNVPAVASVALIKGNLSSCRIPGHHVSDVPLSDTKTSGC